MDAGYCLAMLKNALCSNCDARARLSLAHACGRNSCCHVMMDATKRQLPSLPFQWFVIRDVMLELYHLKPQRSDLPFVLFFYFSYKHK